MNKQVYYMIFKYTNVYAYVCKTRLIVWYTTFTYVCVLRKNAHRIKYLITYQCELIHVCFIHVTLYCHLHLKIDLRFLNRKHCLRHACLEGTINIGSDDNTNWQEKHFLNYNYIIIVERNKSQLPSS